MNKLDWVVKPMAFALALFLSACSGAQIFNKVVLEDVRQAKLMAERTEDVLALKCWTYLEEFTLARVGDEIPAGEVVGVLSTYQKARNVRRTVIEVRLSDEFKLECGPMLIDSVGALRRLGLRSIL